MITARVGQLLRSVVVAAVVTTSPGLSHAAIELVDQIELPDMKGRIDHMAIDVPGSRLFVAALGSDAIEVVDPKERKRVMRLRGREPQGLAYLPSAQHLLIANGGSGTIDVYAGDLRKGGLTDLPDVDNLRLDGKTGLLYAGYSDGLAVVDPVNLRLVSRFPLPGHPESFQLASNGPEVYLNMPSSKRVIVLDRRNGKITSSWDVSPASRNFPMALDDTTQRLLVATRQPARLQVYDTASGRRVAEIPLCGDADDLFFDAERHQAYAVCGEGRVEVVRQINPDRYEVTDRVNTSAGARTGLYVPALNTLFVAVPSQRGRSAEVQIYRVR
jgi:DNA-binding beta-propeller fold protein YncE